MALGGGTFTAYNKQLPGTYVNFTSAQLASGALSDRGIAFMGLELNWGADGVTEISAADFDSNTLFTLGYNRTDAAMVKLRELFSRAQTIYAYRLNGGGDKAENTFATAKHAGTRGNDIQIVIAENVDDEALFDVSTYISGILVDSQIGVEDAAALADNTFVDWKDDAELEATAGTPLTGGTNGTVHGTAHQTLLNTAEQYAFNTIGYDGSDNTTKGLYDAFTRRMREEVGANFQCVLFNHKADYEGIINVKNAANLVPWAIGASAGCAVNASLENATYDGELEISAPYTQDQLKQTIAAGEFTFHRVGKEYRVLLDINSLTTFTDVKKSDFAENVVIRINDQLGNDLATMFNNDFSGKVPNDAAGRDHFWSRTDKDIMQSLADLRAITNYVSSDIEVFLIDGDKKAVGAKIAYQPVSMMSKLYITCVIR